MGNNTHSKLNIVKDIIKDWIAPVMQIVLTGFLVWQVILTRNQFERYEPKITANVTLYSINYTPFIFEDQSTREIQLTRTFKNYLIKANEIRSKYRNELDILSLHEKTMKENEKLKELWKKYFNYDDFKIYIRVNITNESLTTVSIRSIFPWLTPSNKEDIAGLVWKLQKIYTIRGGDIEKEVKLEELKIYSGESVILDIVFYSDFFYSEFGVTTEDKILEIIKKLKEPFMKRLLKISGNFGIYKVYFEMVGSPFSDLYHPAVKELYKTFPEI